MNKRCLQAPGRPTEGTVCALMMSLPLLAGCTTLTTHVDVSYDEATAHNAADVSMSLTYQASKVLHPPGCTVTLDETPKRVKMYYAPVFVRIHGGPQSLTFVLPSPFKWGEPTRYEGAGQRGWALVQDGELRFHFADIE